MLKVQELDRNVTGMNKEKINQILSELSKSNAVSKTMFRSLN